MLIKSKFKGKVIDRLMKNKIIFKLNEGGQHTEN